MNWIPAESPPEHFTDVLLVLVNAEHETKDLHVGQFTPGGWESDSGELIEQHSYKVTHWMRLPDPPPPNEPNPIGVACLCRTCGRVIRFRKPK